MQASPSLLPAPAGRNAELLRVCVQYMTVQRVYSLRQALWHCSQLGGAPSYTGVCSIPVRRLDESIRISDNIVSTDIPFVDENRLSLQTNITGGRQ